MKKLLIFVGFLFFFLGCSTKVIIKKPNPSVEMQKQDAKAEWKELDKE